jgi:hypothetical protein
MVSFDFDKIFGKYFLKKSEKKVFCKKKAPSTRTELDLKNQMKT